MRTSSVITISLPPALATKSEKLAKKNHMTRSELVRTALRHYLETQLAKDAIKVYEEENKKGKLKILRGPLVDLVS